MSKHLNLFALIILSIFLLTACQKPSGPSLKAIDGQIYNLSQYHNQWIIINYWAPWCKSCYKEIPELNRFYAAHRDQVLLLSVNYDTVPVTELTQLAQKMQIQFPVLLNDPGKLLGINNVPGLPATYLINPKGQLEKPLLGEQTQASLQKRLNLN